MSETIGILVAAFAALSWGLVYATGQDLVQKDKFSPFELLISLTFCGALLFTPLIFIFHHEKESILGLETNFFGFLLNVFFLLSAEYLVFLSVRLLGGTEASLIQVSYPIWTSIDLFLKEHEKPSNLTILGGLFIIFGVVVISVYGDDHSEKQNLSERNEQKNNYSTIE